MVLCNRAQVHLKKKQYAEAVEDCTACLTLSPNNVKAMFRRATAFEALGNKGDALKDFREVVRLDPAVGDANAAIRRSVDTGLSPRIACCGVPLACFGAHGTHVNAAMPHCDVSRRGGALTREMGFVVPAGWTRPPCPSAQASQHPRRSQKRRWRH